MQDLEKLRKDAAVLAAYLLKKTNDLPPEYEQMCRSYGDRGALTLWERMDFRIREKMPNPKNVEEVCKTFAFAPGKVSGEGELWGWAEYRKAWLWLRIAWGTEDAVRKLDAWLCLPEGDFFSFIRHSVAEVNEEKGCAWLAMPSKEGKNYQHLNSVLGAACGAALADI